MLHNQKFQLQQQQVEQLGIAKPAAAPPVQAMRRCTSRCISSNRNSNKARKRRRKRRHEHIARRAAPAASWFFYSARSRHEIAAKAAYLIALGAFQCLIAETGFVPGGLVSRHTQKVKPKQAKGKRGRKPQEGPQYPLSPCRRGRRCPLALMRSEPPPPSLTSLPPHRAGSNSELRKTWGLP